jgi:hypothetical protein
MIPRLIYYTPPSGHQIEEQYRSCDNQQKVDQAAADMKAETEQSQDHMITKIIQSIWTLAPHRVHPKNNDVLFACTRAFQRHCYLSASTAFALAPLTAARNECAEAGAVTFPVKTASVVT